MQGSAGLGSPLQALRDAVSPILYSSDLVSLLLFLSYSDRCPIRALRRTRQKKIWGVSYCMGHVFSRRKGGLSLGSVPRSAELPLSALAYIFRRYHTYFFFATSASDLRPYRSSSSVARDNVVLHTDGHVGGPQPAILARTAVAQERL